ncbi:MAG: hypothetical protein ACE5NA_11605, partial [Nitrospiraceae bacterium]
LPALRTRLEEHPALNLPVGGNGGDEIVPALGISEYRSPIVGKLAQDSARFDHGPQRLCRHPACLSPTFNMLACSALGTYLA